MSNEHIALAAAMRNLGLTPTDPPLLTADQQRAIDQAEERAELRRDERRGAYASESEQDAAAAAFENALTRREP